MDTLSQIAGIALIIVVFVDVFLTVLQGGPVSLISAWLARGVWWTFRGVGRRLGRKNRNRLLAYAGPTLIPAMITLWMTLLAVGFALMFVPVMGTSIVATTGETPVGFWPALYFSMMSLVTLGAGDLVANTNGYRLLDTFGAVAGFSIATAAITYLLSVYASLIQHNSFALSLHHASEDTGHAAELVARFGAGGSFTASLPSMSALASELIAIIESHHTYVVLRYFRGSNPAYALPRIAMMVLDSTSFMLSALDQDEYQALIRSTTISQLWRGGMQLLTDLEPSFVPEELVEEQEDENGPERQWRDHYCRALRRFQSEGIATAKDEQAGENRYIELRRNWQPHISAFADYLLYDWEEVSPTAPD